MSDLPIPIVIVDMAERDAAERKRLKGRRYALELRLQEDKQLPPALLHELEEIIEQLEGKEEVAEELARLEEISPLISNEGEPATKTQPQRLGSGEEGNEPPFKPRVVDPLFRAIRKELALNHLFVDGDHDHGKLPSQIRKEPMTDAELALFAVYGILIRDSQDHPDHELPDVYRRFVRNVSIALGEYNGNRALYRAVLPHLANEGQRGGEFHMRAEQWATVVRSLIERGTSHKDDLLKLKAVNALASADGADDGGPPSAITIDLPDLEQQTDVDIQKNNLDGIKALYWTAMLDELKVFQVVDKLLEQFQSLMLPLGKGRAGDALYGYWKKSINRINEVERRNLYARCFGFPGGEPTALPNRDFKDVWLRFVSTVSSVRRQFTVDDLLRSRIPISVSQQQVQKAGRDLAANLSLHGYGVVYFAAVELQNQMREIIELLSEDEIKGAYGARDIWQVIDQVATLELGGAKDSVRYRTMAEAGAVIIGWLSKKADELSGPMRSDIIDLTEVNTPPLRKRGLNRSTDPSDFDLVNACDQWLAVTGTPDDRVEQFAQPVEAAPVTSRPIQIPTVARDMLEAAGVKLNGFGKG